MKSQDNANNDGLYIGVNGPQPNNLLLGLLFGLLVGSVVIVLAINSERITYSCTDVRRNTSIPCPVLITGVMPVNDSLLNMSNWSVRYGTTN